MARETFPLDISADEYAAREGHRWACFSFDDYHYSDDVLTAWIQRLGDILFARDGAPAIAELRSALLSPEEQELIAKEIANQAHVL